MDKAKVKEITKNLPALIVANIPLSEAKELVDNLTKNFAKAEIRMQ